MNKKLNLYEAKGVIPVDMEIILDDRLVVETTCVDYDQFRSLPQLVMFKFKTLKLTGWNSDRQRACYKETNQVARKVG